MSLIDLWDEVFLHVNHRKYKIPSKILMSKELLHKKVAEIFVANKFLDIWFNQLHLDHDPIDILDNMIMTYYSWNEYAIKNNKKELITLYKTYISTLNSLKKYIQKELK